MTVVGDSISALLRHLHSVGIMHQRQYRIVPPFFGVSIRIYVLRLCYGTGASEPAAGAVRAPGRPDWFDGGRARFRALPGQERVSRDPEVYAWTAKAAEVTWKDGPVTYRTWVWSSAVTRREDLNKENLGERTGRDSNSK